ncbi:MAG TPA: DUF1553 domain-containing protein [Cyclobacteriaceae bacterium]|nr:DUF1553 domain-containing protein [Cyclobacteriaceae bacterium]
MILRRSIWSVLLVALVASIYNSGCEQRPIDFSTQVKPILNKRCISCHGGVKRNGGFSLLFRDDALDTVESGKRVIIPGDPQHSEMIRRLTLSDPEERMPYKEEPLTKEEIQILSQWIKEGALWGDHWAYVAPQPVEVPKSKNLLAGFDITPKEWARNDIDYFILQKLEKENLKPSPEADKAILIRRVYLDLIGMPPTTAQAEKFIDDKSDDAYEKVVDELLTSPHFGEKWAAWWLDLARYSDTKGYERDVARNIWRYRDWVINAFNQDKSFDQFTIEQLAGDLLPNPTDDQLIATAFHRNTMNNDEGGTEDEEFRVAALIDRVNTTWEVWQSTTMGCVQCHTHPYDPFVHDEYYKSMAFFNNTRDEDTEAEHPNLRTYEETDQRKLDNIREWVLKQGGPEKEQEVVRFLKTLEPKYHPHDFDEFVNGELIDTKWLGIRPGGSARLKNINLNGKTSLIINYWADQEGGSFEIQKDKLAGEVIARAPLSKTKGRKTITIPLRETIGKHDLYFRFSNPNGNPGRTVCAIDWFAFRDDLPGKGLPEFSDKEKSFMELLNAHVDNTPIMIENNDDQHRTTYVFERGNWLVKGQVVNPEVPRSLNPFPDEAPKNRLGFAMWLTDKKNPLTSRTIVNRFWEQIFGYGLVETLEDFGTQGAQPSHPELLDWLALRFMNDHHWSMKKLLRDIVLSATYRQQSKVTEELYQKDMRNVWLARGPRVRLSAEEIRDQALTVSGLLSEKMFGKSVMPPQPEGIWNTVYNGETWQESKGADRYRRAIYTYSKRTSPYPSMLMFDGSSREVCVSRRIRTNTPLQALVTLNDPVFVEASIALAEKMVTEGKNSKERIGAGYYHVTLHPIREGKLAPLVELYGEALREYERDNESVKKLTNQEKATPELAAMTVVANALLNLDEVITKE